MRRAQREQEGRIINTENEKNIGYDENENRNLKETKSYLRITKWLVLLGRCVSLVRKK